MTPYINGASHQRASLIGLHHDLEQVGRSLGQVNHLSNTTSEVLHGLAGAASLQGLVGTHQPEGRGERSTSQLIINKSLVKLGNFEGKIYYMYIRSS